MYASKIKLVALTATAALGLGACVGPYGGGGFGVGVSSGYGGYGGYGYDPYYDGYGYGGYGYPSGYGGGYGGYGGWYNNYYYPGSGYYVYSRDGHRHRWTDEQQRHWEARRRERRTDQVRRSPTGQWAQQQEGVTYTPRGYRNPEQVQSTQSTRRVVTQRSEPRSSRSTNRSNGVTWTKRQKDD